jgi:hypothetical protein
MTERNCLTCQFWERKCFVVGTDRPNEDSISECRRHPPTVIGYDYDNMMTETVFPETEGAYWCGEWQEVWPFLPAASTSKLTPPT